MRFLERERGGLVRESNQKELENDGFREWRRRKKMKKGINS